MNDLLASYPWPALPGESERPVWTNSGFLLHGKHQPLLCYSEHQSHWSPDLTALHEEEAGRSHPIDLASRRLARHAIRGHCKGRDALILEVGCSSGYLLEELAAEFPGRNVMGADYIAEPLRALSRRHPNFPLLQFDLKECPLPSNSVDAVIALNVLEHIDDDQKALASISRILKPGGMAHIETPAGPDYYDVYDEHLMHQRRYCLGELIEKGGSAGLKVIRATHLGFLVFPAFAIVKRLNRKRLSLTPEEKSKIVASQIRNSRNQPFLDALMWLETAIGTLLSYPCGIRCVVTFCKA